MQKRRVNSKTINVTSDLPVTMHDTVANARSAARAERRANKRNKKDNALLSLALFLVFIILLGLILLTNFDYVSHHPMVSSPTSMSSNGVPVDNSDKGLPVVGAGSHKHNNINGSLTKFPSLKYALENSDVVGIYFAASWCPMSTPISNRIEELFSLDSSPLNHRVLTPPTGDGTYKIATRKEFSLVYVSSDDSEMEMMKYARGNWISIPFDSPDRTNIKRHFRICAQVEMESLGIERRRQEIPSLVIVESSTQGILSMVGKDELLKYNEGVLDHWISKKDLVAGLEE